MSAKGTRGGGEHKRGDFELLTPVMHFNAFWKLLGARISVIQSQKVLYITCRPTCSLI